MSAKAMTLRLTVDQHATVAEVAQALGVSMQQFVLTAIDKHLATLRHKWRPTGSNGMRYCATCNEIEADPAAPCRGADHVAVHPFVKSRS